VSNIDVVKNFLGAIHRNQKDEVLSCFDENAVFNNIPMGAVEGKEGVWSILGPLHEKVDKVDYILHHISETGDGVVLTERTDLYVLNGNEARFPVMGAFEVKHGLIREWRDYFDLQQCLDQLPEGASSPI
jgi:limonene-1,2-epoxide hydrolase